MCRTIASRKPWGVEEGHQEDEEVRLRHKRLTHLPSELLLAGSGCWFSGPLAPFRNVKCVNLSGNRLTSVPFELFLVPTIERLYLADNLLDSIPEFIGNLNHLKVLSCENNRIKTLPANIGKCVELQTLRLGCASGGNEIEAIPETIGNLKNMCTLEIDNNRLRHLPCSIGNLKKLKVLRCSHNKLETLPDSIGDVDALEELVLNNNHLGTLPPTVGRLHNLHVLNVANNSLTVLPGELCWIECHLNVILAGNPFFERNSTRNSTHVNEPQAHHDDQNTDKDEVEGKGKSHPTTEIPSLKNYSGRRVVEWMESHPGEVSTYSFPEDVVSFLLLARPCTICRRPGFMYASQPEREYLNGFGHRDLPFYVTNTCGLCRRNKGH